MRKGFTLVELMLVIGIFGVLFGIGTINFFRTQSNASVTEGTDILVADLKSQQIKAMAGAVPSDGAIQAGYGVHIDGASYTLFNGDTYNADAVTNSVVTLPTGITASTQFANATIVFLRGSGEVKNFAANQDTVTVSNATNSEVRTIKLNSLGVVTEGI